MTYSFSVTEPFCPELVFTSQQALRDPKTDNPIGLAQQFAVHFGCGFLPSSPVTSKREKPSCCGWAGGRE